EAYLCPCQPVRTDRPTYTPTRFSFWVASGAGAYSSCQRAEGRIHPGQATSPLQGRQTHTFTSRGNLACPTGLTVCLWTVRRNPRRHMENTQTPHRKDPGHPASESNPDPSCCEMAALPTAPRCSSAR
ncbi:hypothetical protein MHYP_G00344010, partial [Metynnis hypsauchen]